jgi:hypothetical protein
MTKNVIRVLALSLGLTATVVINPLSAQTVVRSQTITIPFAFRVQNFPMEAGEYRLEEVFGKEIMTLVNLHSGRRMQILRQEASRVPGKPKLIFELGPQGYTLKRLS